MELLTKLPPHDIDAEDAVLGALLIDGSTINQVCHLLAPEDFWNERNSIIYRACLSLKERKVNIGKVTLANEIIAQNPTSTEAWGAYLTHLVAGCESSLDIEYYARIVKNLSAHRGMIAVGDKIASLGYNPEPESDKSIKALNKLVQDFTRENMNFDGVLTPHDTGERLMSLVQHYSEPHHAISYGFRDLDKITAGIYPELIVFGARPSVGKTQIMLDIMENISSQGKSILFASIEMTINALLERKIQRETGLEIRELRRGNLAEDMKDKMLEIAGEISISKIHYLEKERQVPSSQDIYNQCQKLIETVGLDIVFVDYLQLLRDCWTQDRENQATRVGRACKVLKSIVSDFGIPVITASQLNRASEHRAFEDRYPKLADLRESGDIEQDADVVFLLHRDKEKNEDDGNAYDSPEILKVAMEKNRQLGWGSKVKLAWRADAHRYADCT